MVGQESYLRLGWRKPYESRGSRTVLREAEVKLPGLLTSFYTYISHKSEGKMSRSKIYSSIFLFLGVSFLIHSSTYCKQDDAEILPQNITEISWEKDIIPVLKGLVCINMRQSIEDPKKNLYEIILEKKGSEGLFLLVWSGIGGIYFKKEKNDFGKNCQDWKPAPPNHILKQIADIFLSKRHVIAQYSSWKLWDSQLIGVPVIDVIEQDDSGKIKVEAPIGIVFVEDRKKEQKNVWGGYFKGLFSDMHVLTVLMPSIHRFLKAEGIICSDCPGPEDEYKIQNIFRSDLLSYIARSYQLTTLPKAGNVIFRGYITNEMDQLHLILAAKALTEANIEAMNRAQILVGEVMKTKEYKKDMKKAPVNEKLAFINARLAVLLIEDKEFISRSLRWSRIILPELNINCTDCDS